MSLGPYTVMEERGEDRIYTRYFKEALIADDSSLVNVLTNDFYIKDYIDSSQQTPLHLAAHYDSEKCIPIIFKKCGPNNVKNIDENGNTALDIAIKNRNIKAIKALLRCGIKYLSTDPNQSEPLSKSSNSYIDRYVIATLIHAMTKEGLSITDMFNRLVNYNCDTYHAAVCSGNEELLKLVHEKRKCTSSNLGKELMSGTLAAIDSKNSKMVEHMINLGLEYDNCADSRSKLDNGHTLLTYAVSQLKPDHNYVQVVRQLLRSIMDVTAICNGYTAMQWISQCGNVDALKLMITYGGNLDDVDDKNNTLLHLAVQNKDNDMVRFLSLCPINKEAKNLDGLTAKEIAVMLNKEEAAEMLN